MWRLVMLYTHQNTENTKPYNAIYNRITGSNIDSFGESCDKIAPA